LDHCKGSITEGKDADIAIWDPEIKKTIKAEDLHDNMDFTPYEGMEIKGWPEIVIQRGEIIIEDNDLKVERGNGQFVHRKKIDCTGMPGRLAPELNTNKNFGVDLDI
jgi:dihydropyrimidinase